MAGIRNASPTANHPPEKGCSLRGNDYSPLAVMVRWMVILLAVVAFSGCALVRPTNPYRSVQMQAPVAPGRSAGLSFGKQPEGPLDLSQAVEIALANNPDIAAASWDARAAHAQYDLAFGERLPSLKAVGGYAHHNDGQRLIAARWNGEPGVFSRDIVSGDLVLTMPLFTGGRLLNQVRAADLLQEAAEHRLARSREELIFNLSSVFFSILAQKRLIESLEFSGQALEEHRKRVDALVAAQKAAKVDRLRTEVRLADIRQRLVREENVMAIQHRALANLLGLENPAESLSLQGDLASEQKASVPDFKTALATAWSSRDDYLAARSTLEAQARNVDAARAGHWPTVSLQGYYGGRWVAGPTIEPPTGSPTRSPDERTSDDIGRIGVAVEIPLFEGGRVHAKVWEQRARLAAAQERLRKIELQIRLDVETALLNVHSSQERIEAIQKAVEQGQESLRIERQKYELGKGAIVDVLDAQSALLESQTSYFRALADFHTALAQLRLATGEER